MGDSKEVTRYRGLTRSSFSIDLKESLSWGQTLIRNFEIDHIMRKFQTCTWDQRSLRIVAEIKGTTERPAE
jgi:hypothetical protein